MAQKLGISRATISNALRSINDFGITVYKVRGRGYRLSEPMQWLDRGSIILALGKKAGLFDFEVRDVLDSTNSMLLRKAGAGAPHGSVLVAEIQTGGRGRRGRTWHSNLGGGLTFSMLWRFEQGAGFLSGLSLAVGVALIRALREAGVTDAALKWPNDVLHQYRKLAGILIELQGEMLGPSAAVIGIGLNLKLAERLKDDIDQAVVDVHSITGQLPGRNQMLALLLAHLADVLQHFEMRGFAGVREEWLAYHVYQGKPVRLVLPGKGCYEGRVVDVAEDGAILLQTQTGRQRFAAGEISLRGLP